MYLVPDVSKWIAEWLKNLYILSVLLNDFLQCWQLSTISCVKTFGSNVGHFLLVFFSIQVAKSSLFNGVVSSLAPRWQDYQSWWRTVWGTRGSLPASLNQCRRGWCGWIAVQHHPGCRHWYQVRAECLKSSVWVQRGDARAVFKVTPFALDTNVCSLGRLYAGSGAQAELLKLNRLSGNYFSKNEQR